MKITYAPFHRWYKPAVAEPTDLYGKKNRKRILSTIQRLEENAIETIIAPLDEAFLSWFVPMYEETIATRQNAKVHDVRAATIEKEESLSTYYSLTTLQNNEILGGVIFGVREDRLMTAYKVFKPKWVTGTLQANPTLLSEYILSKHAFSLGKKLVSHGKDRNPYGVNAAIGLATFKLSTGYKPMIKADYEDYFPQEIIIEGLKEDCLVLHYPTTGEVITKATLIAKSDALEKYTQLLSYTGVLSIDVKSIESLV
tara:strand:+ start:3552 stop:4316 length:765 start_codon:yes stop_codon:yes gene_type:complete